MNKIEKNMVGTAAVLIGEADRVGIDRDHLIERMVEQVKELHEEMESAWNKMVEEVNNGKK